MKKILNVRLSEDLKQKIKIKAQQEGLSMSAYIVREMTKKTKDVKLPS